LICLFCGLLQSCHSHLFCTFVPKSPSDVEKCFFVHFCRLLISQRPFLSRRVNIGPIHHSAASSMLPAVTSYDLIRTGHRHFPLFVFLPLLPTFSGRKEPKPSVQSMALLSSVSFSYFFVANQLPFYNSFLIKFFSFLYFPFCLAFWWFL